MIKAGKLPICHFRPAIETQRHLELLDPSGLPMFRPKWSKAYRRYILADLVLPNFVYFKGAQPQSKGFSIGIGGSRSPCVETFCLVRNVVRSLATNAITIVSGGVPGVDLSAHLAALESSTSSTIAVLANPVHTGLSGHEWGSTIVEKAILRSGVFISEYEKAEPFDSAIYRERLLLRDRIISGIADVFIVFECGVDSATVDTARRAWLQGKKVLCVESSGVTSRQGIAQLVNELGASCIRESEMSVEGMVRFIKKTRTSD